jgi:hypothetical protein
MSTAFPPSSGGFEMVRGPKGEKRPVGVNARVVTIAKIAIGEVRRSLPPHVYGHVRTALQPIRGAEDGHVDLLCRARVQAV